MGEKQKRKTRAEIRKIKKIYRKRKILIIMSDIFLLTIILILSYMLRGIYKESRIRTLAMEDKVQNWLNEGNHISNEITNMRELNNRYETIRTIKMPEIKVDKKYKGYEVECRLEIPKIKLNTNVLKEYSEEGLKICVSKYYGADVNEVGNYCIAGHNYNEENMFNHLIDLEIGDNIFLTDNNNGIVEYIIYDIYKVTPYNVKPLSQETNGKRELTLITCVNYSKNRLIVKAIEK